MSKNKKKTSVNPSAQAFDGEPDNAFDMVNKYGTYEIQPTNGMENEFPSIGQGNGGITRRGKKKGCDPGFPGANP